MRISSYPAQMMLALAVGLGMTPAVNAIVGSFDATATAEIDEFVGSQLLNSDRAFEDLEQTTSNLPLVADAVLRTLDADGFEIAGAQARTMFNDPRLSEDPNPGEFGIDLAAFGVEAESFFSARCASDETRQITFLTTEIQGGAAGDALRVSSQFFLDGFMVIWGLEPDDNFAQLRVNVALSVEQTRPTDAGPQRVLEATLSLEGRPGGNAELVVGGALNVNNVVVTNISGQLPGFGPAFLVVIPEIGIPYEYSATVGEQFVLKAFIEGTIRNQPGTGAGVALGVPVDEFRQLVDDVSRTIVDEDLSRPIWEAVASAPPALKALPRQASSKITLDSQRTMPIVSLFPLCGPTVAESLALVMTLPLVMVVRPRRKAYARFRNAHDGRGADGCPEDPGH